MKKHIGIYNANMRLRGGGEKRSLVMADFLSHRYRVTLIVREPIDVAYMESYFGVDLSRVQIVVVGGESVVNDLRTRYREYREIQALRLDLLINNSAGSKMVCPTERGVFMCMFPHQPPSFAKGTNGLVRLAGSVRDEAAGLVLGRHPHAYRSYSTVTANSEYTAGWVQRYWGVQAEVVYSVCDPIGPDGDKDKILLSVGRFYPNSKDMHPKNQAMLIDTFKQMSDLHQEGWELHLAGSSMDDDPATTVYLDGLRESAAEYPIFFHCNASREALHQLYRRAAIYWHATGYGFRMQEHPDKQEHFGITTVEAMSAGCVPIVINTGGQPESVKHGCNGLLWDDLEGLAAGTRQVIADPQMRQEMSDAAITSSARFSRAAFTMRIEALIERLLAS